MGTLKLSSVVDLNDKNLLNPVGTIIMYLGTVEPDGYLFLNGQAVSRTIYSNLFTLLGTTYGPGDGVTTFDLPDYQALSPRGTGTREVNGRTKEGPDLGEVQEDQMQRITGRVDCRRATSAAAHWANASDAFSIGSGSGSVSNHGSSSTSGTRQRLTFNSANSTDSRTSAATDGETRSNTFGINYAIKF